MVLTRMLDKIKSLLRGWVLSIVGFRNASLISPFAWVSASGSIIFGRRVSIKKVRLNAQNGIIELGEKVWLNDGVEINSISHVVIGAGTTVQRNVTINGEVSVGAECLFAPNVFVSSTSHVHDYLPGVGIREQERRISREHFLQNYNKPIVIGDDVWLGVNVVLMPGVTIGSHVVIGANSVVNINIPSGTIAAGVPVRVLKKRPGFEGL